MNEQWIIVYGNPVDGLSFEGPFGDRESAIVRAENAPGGSDWWIASLLPPIDEVVLTEVS